jgi:prolyl-tRNA synthetase
MEQKKGFIRAFWCGRSDCEEKIKDETMATIRIIPLEQDKKASKGKCVLCQNKAETIVVFAKAY